MSETVGPFNFTMDRTQTQDIRKIYSQDIFEIKRVRKLHSTEDRIYTKEKKWTDHSDITDENINKHTYSIKIVVSNFKNTPLYTKYTQKH